MNNSPLQTIKDRVRRACERCGRDPSDITVIGASKGQPVQRIVELARAGLTDFGENYEQELAGKVKEISETASDIGGKIRWHFIGTLQRRKIRNIVERAFCIHSLDSEESAAEINARAEKERVTARVLIQLNMGEETKRGVAKERVGSLLEFCNPLTHLAVEGLMCFPPYLEDPEGVRPFFREARELMDETNGKGLYKKRGAQHATPLHSLSMGMSHDFEVAIEEGATMIRIGTALFGNRG